MWPGRSALAVVGLVVAYALWWRRAARRRHLPCPVWLGWLLENPYTNTLAGSATLLDRADVGPGMRVLDAGCGTGRVTIAAAERVGRHEEVVALDVQPGMLSRVNQRAVDLGLTNIKVVLGAIEGALLEAESFDRVMLVTVLGEIPDPRAGVRALAALLKPGGVLSVTEVIPDPHYQSRRTVARLAKEAGLEIEGGYGTIWAFTLNCRKVG